MNYINKVLEDFEEKFKHRGCKSDCDINHYFVAHNSPVYEIEDFLKQKLQEVLDKQKEELIKKLEGEKLDLLYSNERIRLETLENPVFAVVTFPKLTNKLLWKNNKEVVRKEITEIVENHEISREIINLAKNIDDEFESRVYDATIYKWSDFSRDINGSPNVPDKEELYYNQALDRVIEIIKEEI